MHFTSRHSWEKVQINVSDNKVDEFPIETDFNLAIERAELSNLIPNGSLMYDDNTCMHHSFLVLFPIILDA